MNTNAAYNHITIQHLRDASSIAESLGALTQEQLAVIYKEKWFKIFVPEEYGGLQLPLPEALKLEQQLAYIDGSLGWTITLCAGANMFVGYLDKNIAHKIFLDEKVCFGGSGAASGIALATQSGYLVNGCWKYATGTPHLTHFTANCNIIKAQNPIRDDKTEILRSFFFDKKNVTIQQDWDTIGLIATAGHSFCVKNLQVDSQHSFLIEKNAATHEDPVYKYPFLAFAAATIAVNTLGMYLHFQEEVENIVLSKKEITGKQYHYAFKKIKKSSNKINHLKDDFYRILTNSWEHHLIHNHLTEKDTQAVLGISTLLAAKCRQETAKLYPLCGVSAAKKGTTIDRIFRDIFTAAQHSLLNFPF